MTARSAAALDRLREVRTADDLLRYFIDELDWPLDDEATLEDEDLTFDFDLEELGVPRRIRNPIQRVRQVRPFTPNQPWGIFFVELAGPRLLITQLRGILATLIRRRRAQNTDRRSWDLNDLMFIVTTGAAEATELHLLVFYKVDGKIEFRCLSWRPADSTLRLRRLAEELLPQLTWPWDERDAEAWRSTWRSPFTLRPGETIGSAARLADRMARTAAICGIRSVKPSTMRVREVLSRSYWTAFASNWSLTSTRSVLPTCAPRPSCTGYSAAA